MTTVVVTGGAGFVGSHLCDRLLAEGKRVVAVDDLSTGHIANLAEARGYGPRFTFYNVDIRADGLPQLLERHRPDVVMHLAARWEDESAKNPPGEADVGVMGLLNVLDAVQRAGVGKVVMASSASIYGEARRFPVKETAAAGSRPLTPGAVSKKVAEDYLRFYQRYRGVDFTVLVLASVYGPRQYPADGHGPVASIAGKMLARERPVVFGDGQQTRDFVFINDAVHAFSLAIDRGSGRTINIGTGLETAVNGVFRMLADITGYQGEPEPGPPPVRGPRRECLDIEAAERELGWRPWTHLEDGLRETVAFLRTR